jgi:hypothetical protein
MSEAVQTYQKPVNLLELFLSPAQDVAYETTERRDRFPSRYRTQLAYDLINDLEKDKDLFQIKQFCHKKGITEAELEVCARDNTTLRRALEFAKMTFETRLVEMGFHSQKATMAIFALKNQHNYRDRQSSDDARQQIVVNLHLPGREGAVMAKYEVIDDKAKKRSRRGAKIALEERAENRVKSAVETEIKE